VGLGFSKCTGGSVDFCGRPLVSCIIPQWAPRRNKPAFIGFITYLIRLHGFLAFIFIGRILYPEGAISRIASVQTASFGPAGVFAGII
jgi:hypothetical protein